MNNIIKEIIEHSRSAGATVIWSAHGLQIVFPTATGSMAIYSPVDFKPILNSANEPADRFAVNAPIRVTGRHKPTEIDVPPEPGTVGSASGAVPVQDPADPTTLPIPYTLPLPLDTHTGLLDAVDEDGKSANSLFETVPATGAQPVRLPLTVNFLTQAGTHEWPVELRARAMHPDGYRIRFRVYTAAIGTAYAASSDYITIIA